MPKVEEDMIPINLQIKNTVSESGLGSVFSKLNEFVDECSEKELDTLIEELLNDELENF